VKKYILFNKPYNVISQFSSTEEKRTLAEFSFPKNVYPVGRLDYDSEGLLLLTDDGDFHHRLIAPAFRHERTYLVQVENIPSAQAIQNLQNGVIIERKKTLPAIAELLQEEPLVFSRPVPIRHRKNIPTRWLKIILCEGRNRQIRKMTASIGCPTLRLIRVQILCLTINMLQPGEWRYFTDNELQEIMQML
jgi:23S rRNA pseudouridine2457 synthase